MPNHSIHIPGKLNRRPPIKRDPSLPGGVLFVKPPGDNYPLGAFVLHLELEGKSQDITAIPPKDQQTRLKTIAQMFRSAADSIDRLAVQLSDPDAPTSLPGA